MKSISYLTGKPVPVDSDEPDDAKEMSAMHAKIMAQVHSQLAEEVKMREAAEEQAEQHRIDRQIAEQERDNVKSIMANMENMMATERKLTQEQIGRLTTEIQSLANSLGSERSLRLSAEDKVGEHQRAALSAKAEADMHKKSVAQLSASLDRANKELEKTKEIQQEPVQPTASKQVGGFDVVVTSRDLNGNLQGLRVKPIKEN